jgi:hypothetical protein
MPRDTDIRKPPTGGHVARYGKGALRRPQPVVREDTAPPAPTPALGSPGANAPFKKDRP